MQDDLKVLDVSQNQKPQCTQDSNPTWEREQETPPDISLYSWKHTFIKKSFMVSFSNHRVRHSRFSQDYNKKTCHSQHMGVLGRLFKLLKRLIKWNGIPSALHSLEFVSEKTTTQMLPLCLYTYSMSAALLQYIHSQVPYLCISTFCHLCCPLQVNSNNLWCVLVWLMNHSLSQKCHFNTFSSRGQRLAPVCWYLQFEGVFERGKIVHPLGENLIKQVCTSNCLGRGLWRNNFTTEGN